MNKSVNQSSYQRHYLLISRKMSKYGTEKQNTYSTLQAVPSLLKKFDRKKRKKVLLNFKLASKERDKDSFILIDMGF